MATTNYADELFKYRGKNEKQQVEMEMELEVEGGEASKEGTKGRSGITRDPKDIFGAPLFYFVLHKLILFLYTCYNNGGCF